MRQAFYLFSLISCFLNSVQAAEKDTNDVLVEHKGRQYIVKERAATYPEMVKDLTHTFTPKNELENLFNKFKKELDQNISTITLGQLEERLKQEIEICELISPLLVEFRKFERPKRHEGVIEGTVAIPQLTTVDSVRQANTLNSHAKQQITSKTTFILTPQNLTQLADVKINNEKGSSNQWEYLKEVSQKLGNLSLTFNCNTTFEEGGQRDPIQTLALVDANISDKKSEEILDAYEEKMLIGPNAAAFTISSTKRVFGIFIYAPKGEKFPFNQWGTGSERAASQFWDKQ